MEPFMQCEGIPTASSASNDDPESGNQYWEETWMPVMQPTANHHAQDITRADNTDTLRYVHTNALEELPSNFDRAITSISLHGTMEAPSATLANGLLPAESEDFETWLQAFGASPRIMDGLINPQSSDIPLFPVDEIQPISGSSIWEEDYYTNAAIHGSLSSSYLCLANDIPNVMRVNSTSAPIPYPTNPGFDRPENHNGSTMRYQLVRKLAPAAEAQFIIQQARTVNNEQLPVPAAKPRRIRQRFEPSKKEKIKEVRRLGACLRCRIYKEPCDQNTPCARCTQKATNARLFKQPCYRESLDNVVPFRLGCASLGQVRSTKPTFTWSSDEQTLKIVCFLSEIATPDHSPVVTFECRRFVPATGDKIDIEWRAGDTVFIVKRPPYAIFDLEKAFKSIETFLDYCQPTLEALISETTPDEILALTLAEANRFSEQYQNPLIRSVLKVRKFAARRLRIQNSELDIEPPMIDSQNIKQYKRSTCPPYLNYQIDYMINQLIDRHRKIVLKGLKSLIFGGKNIHCWYEVFLLIYLLLSTLEFAYQHQVGYTAETVGTSTYRNVDYVTRHYLAEWEYSASILIAHFKCVLRGQIPFLQSPEEASKSHTRAGLDAQSTKYLQKITVIAKNRNQEITTPRVPGENEYEYRGPSSWTSLLFSDN